MTGGSQQSEHSASYEFHGRHSQRLSRSDLFEIHDSSWFPAHLRNLVTDALQAVWEVTNAYRPIAPLLRDAMAAAGTTRVLDLCSGAGGPWIQLARHVSRVLHYPVTVCLTDKHPNPEAFARAALHSESQIRSHPSPVYATCVPVGLRGFRTIFSSAHHLGVEELNKVVANALECRTGIAIFEACQREWRAILSVVCVPFLGLLATPWIRPFRWSRLFWTYFVPVVPFVLLFDGWMSCLRSYSQADYLALVAAHAGSGYRWQVGVQRSGIIPITYLIGYPVSATVLPAGGACNLEGTSNPNG
ncbi:MAG: hypothetical protein J0H49_04115 [Acidobacteria bacterium]|nr:hypothetical protein [Acidobacteriota bacterium]